MFILRVEENFCCAHRLFTHEGACKNLHGHNYKVLVFVSGSKLNDDNMLIDFSQVKQALRKILFEGVGSFTPFDHSCFVCESDPMTLELVPILKKYGCNVNVIPKQPTAEVLASLILSIMKCLVKDPRIVISSVEIYETPTSSCKVEFDDETVSRCSADRPA